MRNALTREEVLKAIPRANHPMSIYIADQIWRDRKIPVKAPILLRRLKQLESDGLVTRSRFPTGYYGYLWELTEAGRAFLAVYDPPGRMSSQAA